MNNSFILNLNKHLLRIWKNLVSPLIKVNTNPIFILGNQKSGTTAIASLLAYFTNKSVTLDLKGIYEPVQTMLHYGKISFEEFVYNNKYDFSRQFIKEPSLTFLLPQIKNMFPRGRYIMVIRDPRENIRSILNRLRIDGNLSELDITNLNITPEWKLVLDGYWLGLSGQTYIDMLAKRWNLASDIYFGNSKKMILIKYEDFITDKVGKIADLANQLELHNINDISKRVNIQYQPSGNKEITWEDFYGIRNLERIEEICRNNMQRLNYSAKLSLH